MGAASSVYWCRSPWNPVLFPLPREKQVEYLELAKTYLECKEPKLCLKCLSYAKEFQLCAQLCERLGKVRPAHSCSWENWAPLGKWRGDPSLPPPLSGRAPVLPRERLAVLTLWVALLSPFAQRFRWFQGLCACVFVCPCLYEHLWPVVNHREATCSHKGKLVFKESCLLFFCVQSGVSLGGRSGSYMVVSLCPST